MWRHTIVLLLAVLLAAGCATPPPAKPVSYAVLLENADGTSGAIRIMGAGGAVLVTQPGFAATLDGASPPYRMDQARLNTEFGPALAARPPLPVTFILYFDGTSTTLTPESKVLIPKVLAAVSERPAPDVSIVGHTDTLGSAESNERLGMDRARVAAALIADAGLKVAELAVLSSGESDLLVKTPDQTAEPRNRRVEITIR